MKHALLTYQKRLTNLSAKNRSLLLLKLLQGQALDLHALDMAVGKPAFDCLRQLLAGAGRIRLAPVVDSRFADGNKASHALRQLCRIDQAVQEERGAQDLFVGYPFVRGRLLDDTPVRAPLLFFPVSLGIDKGHWVLEPRLSAGISYNKTLLLAFSHFNGVPLDEALLEEDFSEFPQEARGFLTALYQQLEASHFEANLGQQAFEERLQPFEEFAKERFEQATQTGRLQAVPEAVLGLFPQAGSYLMPDYEVLLQHPEYASLEHFFLPESPQLKDEPAISPLLRGKAMEEESLKAPYPIDAAQERALHAVKTGNSIVVQGPPGSGKSQLICNLIADAVAAGKQVLLVCQKKAALDVVYQRLDEKGLADFAALVHDFRQDRAAIFQKIARNIELLDEFKQANNSLDAIYLERNFLKYSREIDRIAEQLDEFRAALFDTSECGVSAKELYMTAQEQAPRVKMRQEYEHFRSAEAPDFLRKLRSYARYAERLDRPQHPWGERVSFASFGPADQDDIARAAQEVLSYRADKAFKVASITSMEVSLDDCEWIHDRADLFRRLMEILADPAVMDHFRQAMPYSNVSKIWLANQRQLVMAAFGDHGVEATLDRQQLARAAEVVDAAIEAKKKWHHWAWWQLFSKEKVFVQDLILNNSMEGYDDALGVLMRMIENRMNLEHQLTALRGRPWLYEIPENYRRKSFEQWFDVSLKSMEAKEIYDKLRTGVKYLRLEEFTYEEMKAKLDDLLETVSDVPERRKAWGRYLSRRQVLDLEEGKISADSLVQALDKDFDHLCAFDQLKREIAPFEQGLIDKLREAVGKWDGEEMAAVFANSLRTAWLHHIEAKYPVLRIVSSHQMEELEAQLQEAIERKQEVCLEMVLMQARERMYKEVEYNRLSNRVTYRELHHQVCKKRRVWPLRKLVEQFDHELFHLMPCWMASPESVSAVFPMRKLFDLVIFDEASQCYAEKGLPAIFRGMQTVIVGDSQQLPPYDLYQARWEDESDGAALEVDSLLDLGTHYLEQFLLTGHYRSEAPELIGFSNRHFYQGKLKVLPSSRVLMGQAPAIRYEQVPGVWEKQTNPVEAERVVAIVRELLEQGRRDIGIITFNYRQQDLIRDLLDESGLPLPASLFVKNIENVQGDERDVVIFSVGYAPSASGALRMQFGALGQAKGGNRLNVAITRAKRQVWVVSSLQPQQLQVDGAQHEGPRLLRDYLQYARDVSLGQHAEPVPPAKHDASWYLKQRIANLSDGKLPLRRDYPFADLALLQPDRPAVALTDDDLFHQSLSAKEAHAYVPAMLRQQGWRCRRFYSRQYWKDREGFDAEARKFLWK
jgi:hypothetical protein